MKLEVIGWTEYDDHRYPVHKGDEGAVNRAVLNALRAGGYRFGGNRHQEGYSGAPVLNDGTRALYTMRGWGKMMAMALGIPDKNGMAYMQWYMDTIEELMGEPRREIVVPPSGVDESRIKKRANLAETFEMHLVPDAFAAVAAGKKTVELRLDDEKRKSLSRGDIIRFSCGNESCLVRVTAAERFENFSLLFGERQHWEDERQFRHRNSLVRRARFGACSTPQKLADFLLKTYSEEEQKDCCALAISIKLLEWGEKNENRRFGRTVPHAAELP